MRTAGRSRAVERVLLTGERLPKGDAPLGVARHHPDVGASAVCADTNVRIETEAK